MNTRDKDKIKVLINEAKVWVDTNSETEYYYDHDTEDEVPVHYLEISKVKGMLDDLKAKLMKDDITDEEPVCTCKASFGCKMFQEGVKYGVQHGKMPLWQLKAEDIEKEFEKHLDKTMNKSQPHLRDCPSCHSKNVEAHVNNGSWGYYPASAYIECKDCGLRSREYDGKDDCDKEGAILKATVAWNRRH